DGLRERELRLRMREQQAPLVQERLRELEASQGDRPGFLVADTPELATAGLVQRLESAVSEVSPGNRSCAISNRSPLRPDHGGAYVRVAVEVRLVCGTAELAAVLHALESGSPRLFVDNLDVLAQRMYGAGGATPQDTGGVDASFDLSGYLPVPGGGPRWGLEPAGRRTRLLAVLAGVGVMAWLAALAGAGSQVALLPDDASLAPALPASAAPAAEPIGPLHDYAAIGERPLFSTDRTPRPLYLPGNG